MLVSKDIPSASNFCAWLHQELCDRKRNAGKDVYDDLLVYAILAAAEHNIATQ
jgi:hypothetical protein